MATLIPNPTNIPEEVSTGYQRQNILVYASMVGFSNINMSNTGVISAGSIIEINGTLVRSYANENVLGMGSIPQNSIFFIYAVPISETEIEYQASTNVPTWNTEKCGYYNNSNRAVIRASKDTGGNVYGVIKMNDILYSDIPANTGGSLIYSKNVRSHDRITANAGWYRYEMSSGLGKGNGGDGISAGVAHPGGPGGVASTANTRSAVFWHSGGEIIVHVGGNGYTGETGAVTGGTIPGGGGSGSGAGEETSIKTGAAVFTTGRVDSGKGGNGLGTTDYPGGTGSYFGLSGGDGAGGTKGGSGFDSADYGYGGCGGGGGGAGSNAGKGGGINVGSKSSHPGWAREMGDTAAGYCRIYQL
jgi:hypothetical protein